jgi:hypothetical protein
MSAEQRAAVQTRPWVTLLAVFSSLWIALIWLRIPDVSYTWGPLQQNFLVSMMLMAVSTFPVTLWVRRRFLNPDGDPQQIRTGALLMAAMGQACAVYGYAVYWLSGDAGMSSLFAVLAGAHHVLSSGLLHTILGTSR